MKYLSVLFTIFLIMTACSTNTETENDGTRLAISWELIRNFDQGGHEAKFVLTNTGDNTLTSDWEMYWNMAPRGVDQSSITAPVEISWINGDFFVMKPKEGFELTPGSSIEIQYQGEAFMIKESDGPLGLFLVETDADGTDNITELTDYDVIPFERKEQIDRMESDEEPIPTPEHIFTQQSEVSDIEDFPAILPQPRNIRAGQGTFTLSNSTALIFADDLASEGAFLKNSLGRIVGELNANPSNAEKAASIRLGIAPQDIPGSYTLSISQANGVEIRGDRAGVFYGIQSLLALVPVESLEDAQESVMLPAVEIDDTPAFQYRGFFLDVSRNFNSLETVKRILDVMAFYKLNKFHIHLTEDEGWRIEIEELPELTEYGSKRGFSRDESEFLNPAYGSGPYPDPSNGYGSGYYTRDEFKEMLRYAAERHIEVIPEFNVPGHSRAAIKAMEYRYRKYMAEGNEEEAEKFRLADPDDTSEYRSAQWYTDNTMCVCRESSFRFVTTVLDDIIEMYEEVGIPLKMMHMGGDEVPLGAWTASPMCEEYLADRPEITNPKNLQKVFFRRVSGYLREKGIVTSGWEEIAQNFALDGSWTVNDEFAGKQVVPYVWNSVWGAEDLAYQMANAGYPIVLCPVSNFYFDLAYNKDPRESGLYWAGFVDTRDAFDFVPYDMFQSTKVNPFGQPYKPEDFEGKQRLNKSAVNNILGVQAQLWSETVKGRDMAEYYIMPKLMGLAERAWFGSPSWADLPAGEARETAMNAEWNKFANALGKRELPRLDKFNEGYNYRLPPPGAMIVNGKLEANVAFPGLEVRFTTDGTDPTADSELYTNPLEVGNTTVKMVTIDSRGRTSLPTTINLK